MRITVLGRGKIPFPYVEPTVAWRVRIENNGQAAHFTIPKGPAYGTWPCPRGMEWYLLDHLQELASDEAYLYDSDGEGLTPEEEKALGSYGYGVRLALTRLGVMEE